MEGYIVVSNSKKIRYSVNRTIRNITVAIARKLNRLGEYQIGEYGLTIPSIVEGTLAITYIRLSRSLGGIYYLNNWNKKLRKYPDADTDIGVKAIWKDVSRYIRQEKSIGKPIVKEHLDRLSVRDANRNLHGLGFDLPKLAEQILQLLEEGHKLRNIPSLLGLPRNWKQGISLELAQINPDLAKAMEAKPKAKSDRSEANRRAYLARKAKEADNKIESVVVLPQWVS